MKSKLSPESKAKLKAEVEERWAKPEPAAAEALIKFESPSYFRPGPTNPRTEIADEDLAELRLSLKTQGFKAELSHLMVREVKHGNVWGEDAADYLEIICGERRWRAAMLEKIELIPYAVVRMSDREVLEIQLVENLQREDLTAIQEGHAFRSLSRMIALEEPGLSETQIFLQIAGRIGKSGDSGRRYVWGRVRICSLDGTATAKALARGDIGFAHARAIAAVPSSALRDEILAKVLKPSFGPGPEPAAALEKRISLDYTADLRGVQFDRADAELVPIETAEDGRRLSGGSCLDCPHNTENTDDKAKKGRGMCLNLICFRTKEAAAHERWREKETNAEARRRALSAEENAVIWNHNGRELSPGSKYVELAEEPDKSEVRRGAEVKPWKKLLAGSGVEVILAKDTAGKVHELVEHEVALTAAREKEKELPASERIFPVAKVARNPEGSGSREDLDEKSKRESLAVKAEKEKAARIAHAQLRAVTAAARKGIPEALLLGAGLSALVHCADEHGDLRDVCLERGMLAAEKDLLTWMDEYSSALATEQARELFVELLLMMLLPPARAQELPTWGKALGVRMDSIAEAVEKEIAVERAHANADSATAVAGGADPSGLKWVTTTEDMEQFNWLTTGQCGNPDRAEIEFPAALEMTASVTLAQDAKGWHVGWFVNGKTWGTSDPCMKSSTGYGSRILAAKAGLLALVQQISAAPSEKDKLALETVKGHLAAIKAMTKGAK